MKKYILGIVAALGVVAHSQGAAVINWGNAQTQGGSTGATPGQDILDPTGAFLPTGSSFLMLMYQSTDNVINYNQSTLAPGGDEHLVASVAFSAGAWDTGAFALPLQQNTPGAVAGQVSAITSGAFLYTVLLNASTVGAATQSAILDGAGVAGGTTTTLTLNGANIGTYDTTGMSTTSPFNWVATTVPEPATFAFLGMGGILLAVRKLRRN